MKLVKIEINNFRGIKHCDLNFPARAVLVGDNNTGKSTILEAIDLVLGPERLSRRPVIDEHDFYAGQYLDAENNPKEINIEIIVAGFDAEQKIHFMNNLEWWDTNNQTLLQGPPPEATDGDGVVPALRLGFRGYYDAEEDDFVGETFFSSPELDEGKHDLLRLRDKRMCGFLYLRTLRTGTRALSLERGSLLDIILKLRELKPRMWEDVLTQLRDIPVADDPELGVSEILTSVQKAIRELVPVECADAPAIRVSQMTREHLRQILTVFLGTGSCDDSGKEYAAPFNHQGTGTINTLVLSLLSMIAELKQNVIFAMEEPEIAIPPHTQKRIINSVIGKSAQAIFTSHSPYVLEEFDPAHILVIDRKNGELTGYPAKLPPNVKQKMYRDEVKRRFCEALLARRVLIVGGRTEYDTISRVARQLQKNNPAIYSSLESLGIAVISADSDSQVAPLGKYFKSLGKTTYAIFDKQSAADSALITESVDYPYESQEKGFENLVLKNTSETVLRRYLSQVVGDGVWPQHLGDIDADSAPLKEVKETLGIFFKNNKAESSIADCLCMCAEDEIPQYIRDTLQAIHNTIVVAPPLPEETESAAEEETGD
ncbi:MAG: ATP-dependent nuclease [Candidatus Saccharimonadales bacterium]